MNNWIDTITLISQTSGGKDADGFELEPVETTTDVFCNEKSVRQSEFYQAQQQGINAVKTIEVNALDYGGQKLCEINGSRYNIYRTYTVKETEVTELTLTENNVS